MRIPVKNILPLLSLFCLNEVSAQMNTNSPYSHYGIGELSIPGFARGRAMGRTGLALRDNHQLNYLNPASYTSQDTLSFLFDFGVNGRYATYETSELSQEASNFNMDHIAIGFPITSWWKSSIGVMPYSYVGYNIREESFLQHVGAVDYLYRGSGGLDKFYLGTALEFFHHLSLGVNFSYVFGALEVENSVQFPLKETYSLSQVSSRTLINGFIYDFGLQYYQTFAGDYTVTLGMVFDNRAELGAQRILTKKNVFAGSSTAVTDSTVLNPSFILEDDTVPGTVVMPARNGAGIGFSYKQKVLLGFDYYRQDWSQASILGESQGLVNSSSMRAGLEVTPDPEALRGYWKRVHYRLGGYSDKTYLMINGEQLDNSGVTFGLGMPLRGGRSSFNMACNMGRRGSLENNLVKEKYVFLSFSVTLHDFWFFKRKFD